MTKINKGFFLILILILIYTRFVNLDWGLPYPFHPDERNIAVSLQQITCDFLNIKECLNPNFFAYGQFYIYLSFFVYKLFLLIFSGSFLGKISFFDAFLTLRIISAIVSIITVFFSLLIIKEFNFISIKNKINKYLLGGFLLMIFSPGLIQFAHFGTTESLLIMFYTMLTYFAVIFINKKISSQKYLLFSGIVVGLASATKISSLIYFIAPLLTILINNKFQKKTIFLIFQFILIIIFTAIIFSPYNLISLHNFFSTLIYESSVVSGTINVFYTQQFENTIPVLFQLFKIFPYVLGIPILIFFIFGIFFLQLNKLNNILRLFFLSYFIPTAFLFTKWTRFMVPVIPIIILISLFFIIEFKEKFLKKNKYQNIFFWIIIVISIIPGIAFFSIYLKDDVRIEASKWINKNIPRNSIILSETGNVIDIPIYVENNKNYDVMSFDFYNLDNNEKLKNQLSKYLNTADYIIVPSRRIFANYTCQTEDQLTTLIVYEKYKKMCEGLKEKYLLIDEYYKMLSDDKKFKKIVEFTSYPSINLFDKKIFEIKDELAEETFSVFDHPVIRIYKKI